LTKNNERFASIFDTIMQAHPIINLEHVMFSKGSDNYGNNCIMDERTENWEILKHV